MAARPESLISKPPAPPQPPQFIPLDLINATLEHRYVTRERRGVVQVWLTEYDGQYPERDRRFSIRDLEEAVAWLGRKESKEPIDAEREVQGLGRFRWQDGEIVLEMPCGDGYSFDLAQLRLFVRAFKRLEESSDELVVS